MICVTLEEGCPVDRTMGENGKIAYLPLSDDLDHRL